MYPSLKQHISCTLCSSIMIQLGSFYSHVVTQCTIMCQCGLVLSVCPSVCVVPCRRTENVPNAEGNTPLHLAVINDNPQCVKLLLIHGADMHISKTCSCMKGLSSTTNSKREPCQCLYRHTQQKAEPLQCLVLKTESIITYDYVHAPVSASP